MPGWSTKSLSSTWLRIKGRKERKKEEDKIIENKIKLLKLKIIIKNFFKVIKKKEREESNHTKK